MLDDHQAVTWISGPAGSGKTMLVASYLDANRFPCLWYKVDAGDNDCATFFYYMGLAVKKAAPRYRRPLPLLAPEYLMGISEFTNRYFEELYGRLEPPFVIVLDNYQEVPSDSPFHEIIHRGISSISERIRVIILSRSEPPPVFIRLRTGRDNTIGWNDIRFTEEESRDLIQLKDKRKLDETTFSLLHKKTEGWVAGLVLLVECSRARIIDYQLLDSLTPEEIFDYFAVEVFLKTENETQEFLLKTAFLPAMTVQMAEKLTGIKTARQILSGLEKNHYFVEKRLETASVYSFHPLFKEFLASRAEETLSSEKRARLRYDAATLLLDAGQVDDAAQLLLEAKDWHRFVLLVLEQAKSLMSQGRRKTLTDWLDAIPREIVEDTPWLLYWLGICRFGFAPVSGRESFIKAFQLFETRGDMAGAFLAWSGAVNTIFCNFDDSRDMDVWIKWLDEKMARGVPFPSREIEVSVSTSMIVALIHRMPEHPDLLKWVGKTLALSLEGENLEACLPTFPFFVYYYISMGEFEDCAVVVGEMRRWMRAQASPLLTISLRLVEALLYCTSAELHKEGVKAALAGLDLAEKTGAHFLDPLLLGAGVHNSLNAADTAMAGEFLGRMGKLLGYGSGGHSGYYFFLSGWCALCAGNGARAVLLAQKSTQLTEELGLIFPASDCRVLLAFSLLETGNRQEAEKQLESISRYASQTQSTFLEHRYNLLAAHFAYMDGNDDAGRAFLAQAMTMGRRKGFATMVNFWQPAMMSGLCAKALEAGIEVAYVRDLIGKLHLLPGDSAAEIDNWPWPVRITTLGRFEIIKDGKMLEFSGKAPHKILLLLKALIACGRSGASEEQLADLLWPDAEGDAALKTLEISLYRLRKLLGGNRAIRLSEGRITLAADCCRVDAHTFAELLDRAEEILSIPRGMKSAGLGKIAEGVRLLELAGRLYNGAFVDGSTEPWALSYRERLRGRFIRAVTLLGTHYELQKQFTEAISLYGKGLEIEEGVEPFYRGLMRCHLALGRRSEAIAVYRRCTKTLASVFGVKPSPEMDALLKNAEIL